MTVIFKIGRHVPRQMFGRFFNSMKGFITFQQNLWVMMTGSLKLVDKNFKSKQEERPGMTIENEHYYEKDADDIKWQYEWRTITINSPNKEHELEEYNECMEIYQNPNLLRGLYKDKLKNDANFKDKMLNNKLMQGNKLKNAQKVGFDTLEKEAKNVANKILDYGIMTEVTKDF